MKLQLAQVVLQQPGWWQRYGAFLLLFHPHLKQEMEHMAQLSGTDAEIDLRPLIHAVGLPVAVRQLGLKQIIDAVGLKRALEEVGLKQVIAEFGLEELLASLTPEQREGLKQRLQ